VPAGIAAHALLRRHGGSPKGQAAQAAQAAELARRAQVARRRLRAVGRSVLQSLSVTRSPPPAGPKALALRIGDALGVLLWIGIWVYGLWVLASAAMWGLILQLSGV
jgi:hypothetical protein